MAETETPPPPPPSSAPSPLPLPSAPSNKRVAAFLVDEIFISTISRIVFGGLSLLLIEKGFIPLGIILEPLYLLLRDALFKGRSLGKWIMGLAVLDDEGKRCGFKKSILRNLLFAAPGILVGIQYQFFRQGSLQILNVIFLIEYFVMRASPEGKRLGDRWARTQVVDLRPQQKDWIFLLISIALLAVFFLMEPAGRFLAMQREVRQVAASLEDYKTTHGSYPEDLDQLNQRFSGQYMYTDYKPYPGGSEYFLTGFAVPIPEKISYSSQRQEWRRHPSAMAWTKEELQIQNPPSAPTLISDSEAPPASSDSARASGPAAVTVILKNGGRIAGALISRDERGLWIEVDQNARMYFSNEEVKEIN